MGREEFMNFMKDQICAINRYKSSKLKKERNLNINNCVFEWIDNNAKKFSDNWGKNKKK